MENLGENLSQSEERFYFTAEKQIPGSGGNMDLNSQTQMKSTTNGSKSKQCTLKPIKACLGTKLKNRREWITADTWKANENRRAMKMKLMEEK